MHSRPRRDAHANRRGGASARATLVWLLSLLVVTLLPGCGGALAGDWKMIKCVPNRELFAIDSASFRRDGSYSANLTLEGKQADSSGTYSFNGSKITLRPAGGGQHAWSAFLRLNQLEITSGKRQVTLARQ